MHMKKYLSPILISLVFIGSLLILSCSRADDPEVDEAELYKDAVSDFYMGLAASQTDEERFAFNKMNDVVRAFPEEAAAWANLGVLAMRQGNFDLAEDRLHRALELQPQDPELLFLNSIMESIRGNSERSIDYLRTGIESSPNHVKMIYALAHELERHDDQLHANEIARLLSHLHELIPNNQVVLFELTRFAAKTRNFERVNGYLAKLKSLSENWDTENSEQLELVMDLAGQQDTNALVLELSFLRNMLQSHPEFQDDLLQVEQPPTELGFLITEFLHLPQPAVKVSAPDLEMRLEKLPIELPESSSAWLKGVTLFEESPPFPISVSNGEVIITGQIRLDFPGNTEQPLPVHAITEIDYNYNFRNDLAMAGSDGFRLYRLNQDDTFNDVTGDIGIRNQTISRPYYGLWAFDIEMDGDLDILLAPVNGSPLVLRNNGDNTFTEIQPFPGIEDIRKFLWADLTGDGTPEATLLSEDGRVIVFLNQRGGRFSEGFVLEDNAAAIGVADLTADGQFNIITVLGDGSFQLHNFSLRSGDWEKRPVSVNAEGGYLPGSTNLFIADIDNNGAFDLILSTQEKTAIWLGDENREFIRYNRELPGGIVNLFDVDGNERLDLMGVTENLEPFQLKNEGTKHYFARFIRARASGISGDQRINSFGIGGEMEVRSGLLYQKQLINSPIVHFGLGEYTEAQMLRIIWPNGSIQTEFAELGMGATIFNEQILKGSCPWLFTNDGEEMHFITDIIWRSPLGLRINAQETAGVIQTLDRVRIPGNKLNPVDGLYDVRVTAELWETHFFDYIGLVAVDHPEGSEIYVDERFVFPAPDLSTRVMSEPKSVLRVTDKSGNDVTGIVSKKDGNYLKAFRKSQYQGLAEEHSIVIELEPAPSDNNATWLILSGWLMPTDSSINLALSQGTINPPRGLKVEIADERGDWILLHSDYGMPAGKLKTILLDLEGVFPNPEDRRVRLTTTSQIYWDSILYAEKMDESLITETKLEPVTMELRYRGYSEWYTPDEVSPKMANYDVISGTTQRWLDLQGFHTRFGDVSELLEKIDDRYVIMNAGDEILLEFSAIDEPREGFTRSYVLVSDGWVKDGDYNTEASATVEPLPYHGMPDYEYPPSIRLQDDPVFQRFREDWIHYHTRYITPHSVRSALNF
ncbi:MAG: tetratricopeptide repeat protein [Balneolaceae bacterium]|nr:MAG: tetratricopeptide repeat protein [Balneolaceae bacterium]